MGCINFETPCIGLIIEYIFEGNLIFCVYKLNNVRFDCVKFYLKLGNTFTTKTFVMLQQTYGKKCLNRMQWHRSYGRFNSGRTSSKGDMDDDLPY